MSDHINHELNLIDTEGLVEALAEANIVLTAKEYQAFESFCHNIVFLNPQHFKHEIINAIEKISKKALAKKEKDKILALIKLNKWEQILAREAKNNLIKTKKPLTEKQIKRIILRAAARIKMRFKIKISKEQLKQAQKAFREESKAIEDTPTEKANAALLNVMKVGIAGCVRIIVAYNWGNLLNVPDVSPLHGFATIDNANRIDLALGDAEGMEFKTIMRVLKIGAINPTLASFLDMHIKENLPQLINKNQKVIAEEPPSQTSILSIPTPSPTPNLPNSDNT